MREIIYLVNDKTRVCAVVSGPDNPENEYLSDGYRKVTEVEMDEFRAITKIALDAGWTKAPRTFNKYLLKGQTKD